MVERLRRNPAVVGLAEYGSASFDDERIDGDYDLIVVVDPGDPDVRSLHFHVVNTPVDLNLWSIEEIDAMDRTEGFDAILLDARVIHDPSGEVARAIQDLRNRHAAVPHPSLSAERIAAMRHGAAHTFDKIRDDRDLPITLKRYLLHQCVYWALPQYFEIKGLRYRGEKHGVAYLRKNEPELYGAFKRFYASMDLAEQTRLARSIQEAVLAPLGGLWQDGELLVFGDHERGAEVFEKLFACGSTNAQQRP